MKILACFRQFNWLCIYLGFILSSKMDLIHFSLNSKLKIEFEIHKDPQLNKTIGLQYFKVYRLIIHNINLEYLGYQGLKIFIVQFNKKQGNKHNYSIQFSEGGLQESLLLYLHPQTFQQLILQYTTTGHWSDVMPCHWRSGIDQLALLFSELIIVYLRR